jgi:hypothetical protein
MRTVEENATPPSYSCLGGGGVGGGYRWLIFLGGGLFLDMWAYIPRHLHCLPLYFLFTIVPHLFPPLEFSSS